MRCIAREPNSGRRSAGFTLIEVLVVAPMVTFLASEGASWITGQTLSINGGFAMV